MNSVSAYKFNAAAGDRPRFKEHVKVEGWLKGVYNGKYHSSLHDLRHYGYYHLHGWAFNLRPHLRRFLIRQRYEWQEVWAPSRTTLRKTTYGRIHEIHEIPKPKEVVHEQ